MPPLLAPPIIAGMVNWLLVLAAFAVGFSCGFLFVIVGAILVARDRSRSTQAGSSTLVVRSGDTMSRTTRTQQAAPPGRSPDPVSSVVQNREDVIAVLQQGGDRASSDRGTA